MGWIRREMQRLTSESTYGSWDTVLEDNFAVRARTNSRGLYKR